MSDQNSTNDTSNFANTAALLSTICMSTCCLLGLYGNAVSALIFVHPIMRSPIDVLLTGLSLIDLSLVALAVPVFVLPSINAVIRSPTLDNMYPYTSLVMYPLIMMAQTCSIWTFGLVSIERYLAICLPLKRHKLLTCREAKLAQITVAALSFLYNFIRFWEYTPMAKFTSVDKLLRKDPMYFYLYYTFMYEVTHFIVPFFVILLLNAFIIRSLSRSRSPTNLRRFTRSQIQQRKTSGMIVVITMMFALCNACPFIINIWEAVDMDSFDGSHRTIAYMIMDVSNFLVLLNSSSTFLIYLMCCRKYRLLFKFYGRFQRPIGGGQYLLGEENNVHCALIKAAYPLRAPAMAYNMEARRSFSLEQPRRSDSTNYSSMGKAENEKSN